MFRKQENQKMPTPESNPPKQADIIPSRLVAAELAAMNWEQPAETFVDTDATKDHPTVKPSVAPVYEDEFAVYKRVYKFNDESNQMVASPAERVPELELPAFPADPRKRW